ncbi:MAG: hypothetical protein R2710_12430 [Acidimicrobiales bacterium]
MLVEGDDLNDPIGDAARSILDGHISLSRRLANAGHFPSIDILASASRVAGASTPSSRTARPGHSPGHGGVRRGSRSHRGRRYSPGSSAEIDRAIALRPATTNFLQQPLHQLSDRNGAWQELAALLAAVGGPTG